MNTSYDDIIKDFLTCFEAKDADRLASFLHPDVVFLNYGDAEVRGKNAVRETRGRLFSNFGALRFETVHQAVNGNVVIAPTSSFYAIQRSFSTGCAAADSRLRSATATLWRRPHRPT